MATRLPLEGDGLIENLFYFLWCKDDFGAGPRIYILHTVLYKFTHPSAWYFTSLKSGKIKKKSKVNLNNIQIEREFTKKRSPTDIVANYIYFASSVSGDSSNPSGNATIEYFDTDGLRDFLYKREKAHNGMLQKFICLLERRVNLKNVYDKRHNIYERGVTFDGVDMYSRPEPVRGAMLPDEVQLLCEQIVDHVTQVSYHKYRISRMVLHLKSDADDKLWLLWCSSLRLLHVNVTEAAPIRPLDIVNDAQVPDFVQFRNNTSVADDKRAGFARCMSCGQLLEQKKLLATTYKAVLDHFQRFMRFLRIQVNESEHAAIEWPPDERLVQAAGGVGFGILQCFEKGTLHSRKAINQQSTATNNSTSGDLPGGSQHTSLTRKELVIPPVIQYLHPTFTVGDFERHRQDPIFLHKPVAVCESCCLVYSDYTTTSLEVNSIRQSAPAILRPHCELSESKKRLDPLDSLTIALAGNSGSKTSPVSLLKGSMSTKKPPALAWKPISTGTEKKSGSKAKVRSTLSNLPSAPQLPQRIQSFDEIHAANFAELMAASGESANPLASSQSASALQQREETFFRELHQQKDLERGHPLHHMLESVARLSTSKKKPLAAPRHNNNGGFSFSNSQSMGALPELFEHQMTKKAATKSPYSIVLRIRDSTEDDSHNVDAHAGVGGAKQQSPKKKSSNKESKANKGTVPIEGHEDGGESDAGKSKATSRRALKASTRFVSSREKKASEEHQDYLFAALAEAQAQLEHMETLASILPASELQPGGTIRDAQTVVETSAIDEASDDEGEDGNENSDGSNGNLDLATMLQISGTEDEAIGRTDEEI
ncbi:hypothetical protein FI667_g6932, partial [Globisporangium splendens]